MRKIFTTISIIVHADYTVNNNYCIFYDGIYLYFFRDHKDINFAKEFSPFFNHVYFVLVVSELDFNTAWGKSSFLLRSWAVCKGSKIKLCNVMAVADISSPKFTRFYDFLTEQAKINKCCRKDTEFEKIISTNYGISCACKSAKNTELLKLYSESVSDTNIFSQILFLVNTISYPNQKDNTAFKNFVNSYFKENKSIPPSVKCAIKKISENKAFGNIEKGKSPDDGFLYGEYFYENIRSSIVHAVRQEKEKENKVVNLKIDDIEQYKVLSSVAYILEKIAFYKLEKEKVSDTFLTDEECYLIKLPSLEYNNNLSMNYEDNLSMIYVKGYIELSSLETKFYKELDSGDTENAKQTKKKITMIEASLRRGVSIATLENY